MDGFVLGKPTVDFTMDGYLYTHISMDSLASFWPISGETYYVRCRGQVIGRLRKQRRQGSSQMSGVLSQIT